MRGRWLAVTLTGAFLFTTSAPVRAQDVVPDPTPVAADPASVPAPAPLPAPAPQADPGLEVRPSYVAPVIGIVSFDFLVNRYGKRSIDPSDYNVSASSVRRNLTHAWVVDNDPFSINQFLHPYQGAMYHGFARSAGLNYWQSLGYTMAGSAMWEIAGETTPPSINDQIATGVGGTFLGEPLFRLASLVLERPNHLPKFWRGLLTAAISPPTEFNRLVYGDRFQGVYSSRDAAIFHRIDMGFMGTASVQKDLLQSITRNEATADFSVDYGLPGKPGYAYSRPFDYFSFELGASSANTFEHIFSRGLLAGRQHGDGTNGTGGVWGLFGTYDYVAPQIYRTSSVAASLGDTSIRRLSGATEMQSTVLAGVGYGAAGTIHGAEGADEQDYHYGLTPQVLASARFVASNNLTLDLTLRDFFVSRVASSNRRGSENNIRVDGFFTVRIWKHNGASLKYIWSRRAAAYPDLGNRIQSRGTFGVFYTYLGARPFGPATR
jgi:hypothetical protein